MTSATRPALSTRQRILDESLRIFAAYGFEGASTRRIAEAAGVNVGLIKYHFDSKELLWKEAADRAFADLHAALGNALTGLEDLASRDRARVVLRRFARFMARSPETVRFLQDAGRHDGPRMRWLIDRHLRPVYEVLCGVLVQMQGEGTLPSEVAPLHLFYLLIGALSMIFHQAPECLYLSGVDPRAPEVADAHADAILRALTPPESPRPKASRR